MGLRLLIQCRVCRRLFLLLLVLLISISSSPLADSGFVAARTSTSVPVPVLVPGEGNEINEINLAVDETEHERRSLMLTTYIDYSQPSANNGHDPGNRAPVGRKTSDRKIRKRP